MDSPIFGSSSKNRLAHSNPINQNNTLNSNRSPQYQCLAALAVYKNVAKLSAFIKALEANKKRFALSAMREFRYGNQEMNIDSNQAAVLSQVQGKLNILTNIIKIDLLKSKIKAWKQLCAWTYSRSNSIEKKLKAQQSEKRKGTPKPGKKDSDWKQNSNSNAIDLPLQNKILRNEIKKSQSEEAAFIASMKDMLQGHEKFLGKGQGKKRK